METMDVGGLITIIILVAVTWAAICNTKTLNQRIKLLRDGNVKIYNMYEVSYNKHFWYLMTFRNPNKLYKDN
jgi:hypothetical protein